MTDGPSVTPENFTVAQTNYPLPSEMRHDKPLGNDEQQTLQEQWNRFNELKKATQFVNPLEERVHNGKKVLAKGTLLHGRSYNRDTVQKIEKTGILSGELVGIPEDTETNYCADFFRVPEDMTIEEYMKWCQEPIMNGNIKTKKPESSYLYMVGKLAKQIAFIIDTSDPKLQPLLEYDAYGSTHKEIMNRIITQLPNSTAKDRLAAILCGIPSNFIHGVIVGNGLTDEEIKELQEIMGSQVMVYKTTGETIPPLISTPHPVHTVQQPYGKI